MSASDPASAGGGGGSGRNTPTSVGAALGLPPLAPTSPGGGDRVKTPERTKTPDLPSSQKEESSGGGGAASSASAANPQLPSSVLPPQLLPAFFDSAPETAKSDKVLWFGNVDKVGRGLGAHRRATFITSSAVILALPSGGVTRVITLENISNASLVPPNLIKFEEAGKQDLVLCCADLSSRDGLLEAVRVARHQKFPGVKPLQVSEQSSLVLDASLMPSGSAGNLMGVPVNPDRMFAESDSMMMPRQPSPHGMSHVLGTLRGDGGGNVEGPNFEEISHGRNSRSPYGSSSPPGGMPPISNIGAVRPASSFNSVLNSGSPPSNNIPAAFQGTYYNPEQEAAQQQQQQQQTRASPPSATAAFYNPQNNSSLIPTTLSAAVAAQPQVPSPGDATTTSSSPPSSSSVQQYQQPSSQLPFPFGGGGASSGPSNTSLPQQQQQQQQQPPQGPGIELAHLYPPAATAPVAQQQQQQQNTSDLGHIYGGGVPAPAPAAAPAFQIPDQQQFQQQQQQHQFPAISDIASAGPLGSSHPLLQQNQQLQHQLSQQQQLYFGQQDILDQQRKQLEEFKQQMQAIQQQQQNHHQQQPQNQQQQQQPQNQEQQEKAAVTGDDQQQQQPPVNPQEPLVTQPPLPITTETAATPTTTNNNQQSVLGPLFGGGGGAGTSRAVPGVPMSTTAAGVTPSFSPASPVPGTSRQLEIAAAAVAISENAKQQDKLVSLENQVASQARVLEGLRQDAEHHQLVEVKGELGHARNVISDLQAALKSQEQSFAEMLRSQELLRLSEEARNQKERELTVLRSERENTNRQLKDKDATIADLRESMTRVEKRGHAELERVRQSFVDYDKNVGEYVEKMRLQHLDEMEKLRKRLIAEQEINFQNQPQSSQHQQHQHLGGGAVFVPASSPHMNKQNNNNKIGMMTKTPLTPTNSSSSSTNPAAQAASSAMKSGGGAVDPNELRAALLQLAGVETTPRTTQAAAPPSLLHPTSPQVPHHHSPLLGRLEGQPPHYNNMNNTADSSSMTNIPQLTGAFICDRANTIAEEGLI